MSGWGIDGKVSNTKLAWVTSQKDNGACVEEEVSEVVEWGEASVNQRC